MPEWKSPIELAKEGEVFSRFMHALLGLYLYEWFISLGFDWQFISGRRKFKWPLIFYFAGRYLLLGAMIGIAISLDSSTPINCQALYTVIQLAGNSAVGLASINLSIRTMAVWSRDRWIVGFLVILILGHWSLILQAGVLMQATWVQGSGCAINSTDNRVLAATFVYSMCFDLIVLGLNAYKLLDISSRDKSFMTSRIAKMIFEDGLIFFVIAFIANLLATIFMIINLNQIMSVIFNVPAAVASTIVASRVVRRLTNYNNKPVLGTSGTNHVVFRGGGQTSLPPSTAPFNPHVPATGVHVHMETFVHEEEDDRITEVKAANGLRGDSDTEADVESKGHSL
ncbi:hypothetical protein H0H93_001225 [Arthromyces matolae]|nr:hypothetical protein H0H93_001225 [Arthromyces matolae]